MDWLFEIFGGIFLYGNSHLLTLLYSKILCLFTPHKRLSKQTEARIKTVATVISVLLLFSLMVGITLFAVCSAEKNPTFHAVGKYMTFISLSVILFQMLLSLVVWLFKVLKE